MDGCRNLFHACVHIGIPLTNKEYLINDEQIQSETNNIKRISFAIDHLHSQTNTDHNYGNAARSNNSSNITEQSINTWPPPPPPSSANEPAVLVDTQPPSSPTMPPESTSSFYRVRFFLN
jgi:hypothetical protein